MDKTALTEYLLARREIDENGCWLWTRSTRGLMGYGQLVVRDHGRKRHLAAHRVAAWIWMGFDLDSSLCVLHRCDVPRCFNPEHLFVGTVADNQRDMAVKGRARTQVMPGESHPGHVLTEAKVREIRARLSTENPPQERQLAREYGVSNSLIHAVKMRRAWKHVD